MNLFVGSSRFIQAHSKSRTPTRKGLLEISFSSSFSLTKHAAMFRDSANASAEQSMMDNDRSHFISPVLNASSRELCTKTALDSSNVLIFSVANLLPSPVVVFL